jgi:hypothetical protein
MKVEKKKGTCFTSAAPFAPRRSLGSSVKSLKLDATHKQISPRYDKLLNSESDVKTYVRPVIRQVKSIPRHVQFILDTGQVLNERPVISSLKQLRTPRMSPYSSFSNVFDMTPEIILNKYDGITAFFVIPTSFT